MEDYREGMPITFYECVELFENQIKLYYDGFIIDYSLHYY